MVVRGLTLLLACSLVAGGVVSVASATPPRPGTDDNGLDENESATLWSRDNDSRYISNAAYRRAYGENRTAVQQAANGTDLTFHRPPATAGIWTRHDHADYTPGNESISVYPRAANLTNGTLIREAHATVFAITPSTVAHTGPNETTHYLAPNGTVLAAVDYRIAGGAAAASAPSNASIAGNGSTAPGVGAGRILRHEITEVRLLRDGAVIARTNGSHRPRLNYSLTADKETDSEPLVLEADIEVRTRSQAGGGTGNATGPDGTASNPPGSGDAVVTDTVTVSDRIHGQVYDLDPSVSYTRYPDGDLGVAVFQDFPWQGYQLRGTSSARVRGVWRFYTARDTGWETLVRSSSTGTWRNRSDALPVAVHAYPSRIGPRLEPEGRGPEAVNRWGDERQSPAGTLGPNVTVEVVTEPYEATYGLAVRYRANASTPITVRGIVRGESRTLRPAAGARRPLRRSNLTVERVAVTESHLTLRLTLRDATTGEPIALSAPDRPRYEPLLVSRDEAYITVGDQRVRTNLSGMAMVRINRSGVYTVRYHPKSWLTHEPAYASSATSVRWHPLATVSGWLALLVQLLQASLPFALALYAGRRLGDFLQYRGDL
jgi:hypothetical protein